MDSYRIALYPGDGIGPDVTAEAVRVMEAAARRHGFELAFTEFDWGHRCWQRTGRVVPDDFLGQLRGFDAIFLGAVGDPAHVDALTMQFVRDPARLDVVVGSNLFGDILSDLAGAIAGSIGLVPSANINPDRTFPSLFEPVHGSAPDIAGRGIANPVGAIRSAAMLLDFLGEAEAARTIDRAVLAAIRDNRGRTTDIGSKATTAGAGVEIARHVSEAPGKESVR